MAVKAKIRELLPSSSNLTLAVNPQSQACQRYGAEASTAPQCPQRWGSAPPHLEGEEEAWWDVALTSCDLGRMSPWAGQHGLERKCHIAGLYPCDSHARRP